MHAITLFSTYSQMFSPAGSNDQWARFEGPEGQIALVYFSVSAQCEPFGLTSATLHNNTRRRGLKGWQNLGLLPAAAAGHPDLCGLYYAWMITVSRLIGCCVKMGLCYWQQVLQPSEMILMSASEPHPHEKLQLFSMHAGKGTGSCTV